MFRSLATVKASPAKDALPKEITVTMQNAKFPPSHMLAIYGPPTPSNPRRKVTLYPVHSLTFAAYCSKLPPFSPSPAPAAGSNEHTIPVRPICLPSPSNYLRLAAFLYTKRADALLTSLLPIPPSEPLLSSVGKSKPPPKEVISEFASSLASIYSMQFLLQSTLVVHGLWQNVCALGVFDDSLWEVLDLAWNLLLTAIAIGTGCPAAMDQGDKVTEKSDESV